ncbi:MULTISPECIES: hypothetical protein [unclassified Paenibacillus]|uniref:hypothetical protein n=1 Tax=unclassified Paenibacillus TaxID=185978 RepID=UPI00278419AD|nr:MULTISPECIES: hypothetical protein [unclassified Paenibacillus]MDQ0896260.1 hypothetical protein [Paenibacillus sp. V4I7]MDQ0913812.1 hypothetical protein [Paenibacillus sp. V4I5]
MMIAEIHNKISSTGSNLHERLEDQLTGNVFGTLRYVPYTMGLQPILSQAYFENESHRDTVRSALGEISDDCKLIYYFWPRHANGEIDLIIEAPKLMIGIEVKYRSGLSSDDDMDLSDSEVWMESDNQLARYQSLLGDAPKLGKGSMLLFVAPADIGVTVYQDVVRRKLIRDEVFFGLLTWENVLHALEEAQPPADRYQCLATEDIIDLLRKKGFEMFNGFDAVSVSVNANKYYEYNKGYSYLSLPIQEGQAYEYR